MLRLLTLGGLSLHSEAGELTGAARQRRRLALLAALASSGDRGLTRDRILGLLWPDVDESRGRQALSQSLYALRRDTGEDDLVTGTDALRLNPAAITSDVGDFAAALSEQRLEDAAALYAGPFLDGVYVADAGEFERWADAERVRHARGAEGAIETLASRAETRGDHVAAVNWWRKLVTIDPLKTRANVSLASALAAAGERVNAVRHLDAYSQLVRTELDAEPEPEVQTLSDRLRHDPRVGAARPASRIPAPPDTLIGRARETDAATALLTGGEVRLLTFTGAGGTGKTRLALETAAECEPYFDAAHFVDLSAVTLASDVESAIADVLDVHAAEGVGQFTAISTTIGGGRLLVVLDNFEQVVSAAPVVARLLAACRNLTVLVTSRVRLGVRGEHEFFVAPLAVKVGDDDSTDELAPAVTLFVNRARSAQSSFAPDAATLATIDAICARLDGLPLAIELAAARCRLLSPATMLARLESGFDLLAGGARDMPARHQTMRRAIQWSYGLLDPVHQNLMARLAVFSGGFSLAAAERVCADDTLGVDVTEGVGTLLDASLLMREPGAEQSADPRLRMLETVREFAHEQLHAAPDDLARRMEDRHRDWVLSVVTTLGPQLTGATQHAALTALGVDRINLLSAFGRIVQAGDATSALAFAAATWRFWLVRRGLNEGREILERALALPAPPEADALRADAMLGAGHISQNAGDIAGASRYFADVLAIRRRLGDRRGETRSLADLGWLAWRRCEYAEGRSLSIECRDLARARGDAALEALALGNLGFIDHCEGNLDAAISSFEAAIAIRDRLADRRGVAFARSGMAWTMCRGNRLDEARWLLDQALLVHRELGDEKLEAFALNVLAETTLRAGDSAHARAILARTLPSLRRIGDRWAIAQAQCLSAQADLLDGRLEAARRAVEESLLLRRQIGDRFGEADSLTVEAELLTAEGRSAEAEVARRGGRDIRMVIGDRHHSSRSWPTDELRLIPQSRRSSATTAGRSVPSE